MRRLIYSISSSLSLVNGVETDFDKIDALKVELQKLPVNSENGFGINTSGKGMSICTSTFDEATYKSDETCHYIDLSNFD